MSIKRILSGHTSPETAYVIEDYPCGFVARCKKRIWLEYRAGYGFRFCSQTTNPKRAGDVWQAVKASTYSPVCTVLYLNEEDHVKRADLDRWATSEQAESFVNVFKPEGIALQLIQAHIEQAKRQEARKAA